MPWLLYQGDRELTGHPALKLVRRPNAHQSGAAFLETIFGHLMIAGDAYVEMAEAGRDARELHALRPDRVTLVADRDGWPKALDYAAGGARRRIVLGEEADALHLKLFHPLDDHHGQAPLQAAAMAADMHNAAARWNKALLDNSARPSGALVYAPRDGGNLTDEQYDKIKQELEQRRTGAAGAGRPLILEGGLDWKSMGLTPKDMDFIEAKNSAARDIALAFGVPPMLLGIPGDNTYSNYKEANRALWTQTVLPLAGRVASDAVGLAVAKVFGEELRFGHDADQVDGR
jgi:HK97 family phage portal protein